jgi:hypothetical protein
MKVKVYINDKFYKTIDIGKKTTYDPSIVMPYINADRSAGLLTSFNIETQLAIRMEPES